MVVLSHLRHSVSVPSAVLTMRVRVWVVACQALSLRGHAGTLYPPRPFRCTVVCWAWMTCATPTVLTMPFFLACFSCAQLPMLLVRVERWSVDLRSR
jgi:hypothetical protein